MTAYYILLGIPLFVKLLCTVLAPEKSLNREEIVKDNKRILAIFFLIYFILLVLRRSDVGIDLANYEYYFKKISRLKWSALSDYNLEYGYVLFNKIISRVSDDFQFFLAVTAFVSVAPLALLYCRESENAILSISIFVNLSVFNMLFSGLRQSIAIGITVLAYHFAKQKKLLPFLLLVFVAFCFHRSAFIFVLFYPVYNAKITRNSLLVIAPVMAVAFIFRQKIFDFLSEYLSDEYQSYNGQKANGAFTVLILFIVFAVYAFSLTNEDKTDKSVLGLRNILILAICIQFFASVNTVAMRMNYYFIPFIPILISKLYYEADEQDKGIAFVANIVMIAFFYSYFFYNAYNGADILRIFPYKPFWR